MRLRTGCRVGECEGWRLPEKWRRRLRVSERASPVVRRLLLIHLLELFYATPQVWIVAGKFCVEISFENVFGELGSDDPGAHAEYVVVFNALVGTICVVTEGRAHSAHFVDGNRGANSGATDHDAALTSSGQDFVGEGLGNIGEIDGVSVVHADIFHGVSPGLKCLDQRPLQRESCMVAAYDEFPFCGVVGGCLSVNGEQRSGGHAADEAASGNGVIGHLSSLEEFYSRLRRTHRMLWSALYGGPEAD